MPRLSDDTLLQRATRFALLDREALLDAYSGKGPEAETIRAVMTQIQALDGKKLATLTPDELRTAYATFVFAEQWEESLADSNPGKVTEAASRKNIALFQEVRMRRWGQSRLEKALSEGTSVPVSELLQRMKQAE